MLFPGVDREFEHAAFDLDCRGMYGHGFAESHDGDGLYGSIGLGQQRLAHQFFDVAVLGR